MQGFDHRWATFPDFLLGATREIWEERGLGARMRDHVHPEVILRSPAGISLGEPAATWAAMACLTAFPDLALLGEDVIWSGTPAAGLHGSHRILCTATHTGDGAFGPATGRRVVWREIADCVAQEGQITEVWRIRDTGGLVRQLGLHPRDWAAAELATGRAVLPLSPERDLRGAYRGQGNETEPGQTYADLLTRVMQAEFSVIPEEWDRACHLELPGGVTGHGHAAADAFWLGLRSALPSADLVLHHIVGREDSPLMPPRAAIRWSLTGLHTGWGAFGAPTGAEVHVLGIAHAEFGPWGLRREWVVYDETAVWTQILMQTGAGQEEPR